MKIIILLISFSSCSLLAQEAKIGLFEHLNSDEISLNMVPMKNPKNGKLFSDELDEARKKISKEEHDFKKDMKECDALILKADYRTFLIKSMAYGASKQRNKFLDHTFKALNKNPRDNFIRLYGIYVMLNMSQQLNWNNNSLDEVEKLFKDVKWENVKIKKVKRHKDLILDIKETIEYLKEELEQGGLF